MRKTILAIPVLTAAAALAASHAETTTYVDGNLKGVTPNSGATLTISDDQQLTLRTGLENVSIPYGKISHAELGAVKENPQPKPLLKFWERRSKPETQLLIVNFKGEAGDDKTMTLELAKPAAENVFSTIEAHTGAGVAPKQLAQASSKSDKDKNKEMKDEDIVRTGKEPAEWWGDSVWKTQSNSDKWNKANATQQAAGSDHNQQ